MAMLEIRNIIMDFDGFHAIDDLSMDVEEGEVRFLIGPNGAGKTTCIDVISGLINPTSGSVTFDGDRIDRTSEFDIVKRGIGRTFQNPTVFDDLTVIENIDLAASFRLGLFKLLRQRKGISVEVQSAMATVGLSDHGERKAGELSHGQKQWLEIAMLLALDPRMLLLDEPVAGMSKEERTQTGDLVTEIAKTRTVMIVEHDMDFVRRFATGVTVMHDGKILTEGSIDEVQANEEVQEVYLGRSEVEELA
ncbi:MAG: urea ABC transporter ATP-binding protein UrtD [Solirubrobacterales bacterium]|nr:urea ABC transporter ATP-binding protein UrtD [Solirubrobacterales bacterium]